MYRCEECGCEFEEPMVIREHHGLDYGYEEMCVCPNCGESGYKEAEPCTVCGENCYDSSGFCECCRDEAVDMLRIDFNHFGDQRITDMIDLFTVALDKLYVDERMAKKK